ncbi:MAG: hypothetical protein WB562_18620 [Candidatus Sulfotelmatobacter sp.]
MKWFFDTTVLVAALLPDHPHHARSFPVFASATRKRAACAAHSLAEAYSTFTRYPGKERMSAELQAWFCKESNIGLPWFGLTAMSTAPLSAHGTAGNRGWECL